MRKVVRRQTSLLRVCLCALLAIAMAFSLSGMRAHAEESPKETLRERKGV